GVCGGDVAAGELLLLLVPVDGRLVFGSEEEVVVRS
ncbi:hypothetical protein A2U01_0117386, partial [Trifolium medium]|nr:hypothetical protein [Trifolium medium]